MMIQNYIRNQSFSMRKIINIFSKFVKIAKDVSGTFIETNQKQDWRQIFE